MNSILSHKHARALGLLTLFALLLWGRVLFTGQVLLPGAMLSGFAPFGGEAGANPTAPWTILQWDSLAQYYPWRHFAAAELRAGHIPLWNPFEFTGTPFVANAQSAVFYPLNLPFWLFDTAYAFGIAAFFHSLLAMFATYFLCQRWQLSRAASVVAAVSFAGCGYLASWALLPTLFATASWLPLCLLLFEKASDGDARSSRAETPHHISLAEKSGAEKPGAEKPGEIALSDASEKSRADEASGIAPLEAKTREIDARNSRARGATWGLVGALACALLAGHAQIFFYIVLALGLRQMFLRRRGRGFVVLVGALVGAALLSLIQILPTLELARYGHRSSDAATAGAWQLVKARALQPEALPSLFIPGWPALSFDENFGYIGLGMSLLMLAGLGWRARAGQSANGKWFALTLTIFGLLYALATPLAQLFFFAVPGVSQMGTPGRALVLWSLGAALLAGYGVDFLRAKLKSSLVPAVALLVICAELGFNAFSVQPTAPRAQIYPQTTLTTWLGARTDQNNRVLFYTPRTQWLPTETLQYVNAPQTHPIGALPPNGALVYRLHEVNGYDSLSLRQYRAYISGEEFTRVGGQNVEGVAPQLNGNMVLINNLRSPILDALALRYIVVPQNLNLGANVPQGKIVFRADGCDVWERPLAGQLRINGAAFSPGWKNGGYNPETFRFGAFVSLCALGLLSAGAMFKRSNG